MQNPQHGLKERLVKDGNRRNDSIWGKNPFHSCGTVCQSDGREDRIHHHGKGGKDMAIITVMLVALAFILPAALLEGCAAMDRRAREAAAWKRLKKAYYSNGEKRWTA